MLKNRFSDVLSTTRTDAMNSAAVAGTRVDDRDYDATKPYNPSWIDPGDWATMIETKWKTDKWRKNSEINKKNKATLTDGEVAKHTSGSGSFYLTKHRMEKETGARGMPSNTSSQVFIIGGVGKHITKVCYPEGPKSSGIL